MMMMMMISPSLSVGLKLEVIRATFKTPATSGRGTTVPSGLETVDFKRRVVVLVKRKFVLLG
jgi:hypothetical protein